MWEKVKSLVESIRSGISQAKPDVDGYGTGDVDDVDDASEYGDVVVHREPSWKNGYSE